MPSQKRVCEGFTLVEILVVVVIIAALAAMILPRFLGQVEQSKLAEAYHMIGVLNKAQLDRFQSTNETPLSLSCASPPATCAGGNALRLAILAQLGLKDFPQRDFIYTCGVGSSDYAYCSAYRWVKPSDGTANNPRVYQFFLNTSTPAAIGRWYCDHGYAYVNGNNPKAGCRVDPTDASWE